MQKHEIYLGRQIYYEPHLWNGAYIIFWPKQNGTDQVEMHHFSNVVECKTFIEKNDEEPETWFERHLA